jgi:hypothetical protein
LAKRYYDRALSTNPESTLPVSIMLFSLNIKYFFHWLRHGGSFYLDAPPSVMQKQDPDPQQQQSASQESLLTEDQLADILKSHDERITDHRHHQSEARGDREGLYEDWETAPPDDAESTVVLVLLLALGLLVWARQRPGQPPLPRAGEPDTPPYSAYVRPPPSATSSSSSESSNSSSESSNGSGGGSSSASGTRSSTFWSEMDTQSSSDSQAPPTTTPTVPESLIPSMSAEQRDTSTGEPAMARTTESAVGMSHVEQRRPRRDDREE